MTATAFLYGMAAEELAPEELDHFDPDYEVIIGVRARKPANGDQRRDRRVVRGRDDESRLHHLSLQVPDLPLRLFGGLVDEGTTFLVHVDKRSALLQVGTDMIQLAVTPPGPIRFPQRQDGDTQVLGERPDPAPEPVAVVSHQRRRRDRIPPMPVKKLTTCPPTRRFGT